VDARVTACGGVITPTEIPNLSRSSIASDQGIDGSDCAVIPRPAWKLHANAPSRATPNSADGHSFRFAQCSWVVSLGKHSRVIHPPPPQLVAALEALGGTGRWCFPLVSSAARFLCDAQHIVGAAHAAAPWALYDQPRPENRNAVLSPPKWKSFFVRDQALAMNSIRFRLPEQLLSLTIHDFVRRRLLQ